MKTFKDGDKEVDALNMNARKFTLKYNNLDPTNTKLHTKELKSFLGDIGENSFIIAPFQCDIGKNIHIGKNSFINYNSVLLDMGEIYIGDNVRIAPNCAVYAVWHPLDDDTRRSGLCYTDEVHIEDDVWICGNVTIFPGVTIGARSVIGAGSVVTKSIPPDSLAYGNPCKVVRKLNQD